MFLHPGGLPHPLSPSCYCSPEFFERETANLLHPVWHCVATTAELARPGDFITFELCGESIQLRNVDGDWRAYSNVCAHRHCQITGLARGRSERIRCQYHGWEYDADGCAAHIPQPKNFSPFDVRYRIPTFRTATCGQLVFVTLDATAPPLGEFLAENYAVLADAFDDAWRFTWSYETETPVNWKIPIENSVEGYHIPAVHADTFKVAPTADRTTHVLSERFTMYRTPNVAPSRWEQILFTVEKQALRILKRSPSHNYSQYHLFPNLLVSLSDMLSLSVSVVPLAVNRTQLRVRLFTYRGVRPTWLARGTALGWSQLNRLFTKLILQEDFGVYPAIQRGLETSPHAGCLGAIEERVFAFQQYVREHCGSEPTTPAANGGDRPVLILERPGAPSPCDTSLE